MTHVRVRRVPALLFALALGLRLLGLDRRSVWFDEAVTYANARLPLADLLAAARFDVHPPLSYALYHFWPLLDAGDAWLRLPSAVLGALAVPLAWAWARGVAGPSAAALAGLLLAVAPFQIDLAQESRMYGLLLALCAASLLALERLLERPSPGRAVTYAALATALPYTHYYGVLWLAGQWVAVLVALMRRERPGAPWALGALLAAGVAFVPWLPLLLAQTGDVREGYWIERPRLATLWITYRALVAYTPPDAQLGGPLRVAYVLVAALAAVGAWRAVRSPRARVAVAQLLVPPTLALVASLLVAPVYAVRYLSPLAVPFGLLVALGVTSRRDPRLRLAALAVALFPLVASLPSLYLDPGYSRPDLRTAARSIQAARAPDEVVLHLAPFTDVPFRYYGVPPPAQVLATDERAELCDALRGRAGGWLVTAYAVDDDAAITAAEAGIAAASYAGDLVREAPWRFLGVSVFHLRPCDTRGP